MSDETTNQLAAAEAEAAAQAAAQAEAEAQAAAAAAAAPDAKAVAKATKTAARTAAGTSHTSNEKVKRVKIILEENDEIPPGGQFFGINGTGYMVKPGVPVEVPEFIIGIIETAVVTKPVLDENNRVVGHREVPRFPYRLVK